MAVIKGRGIRRDIVFHGTLKVNTNSTMTTPKLRARTRTTANDAREVETIGVGDGCGMLHLENDLLVMVPD